MTSIMKISEYVHPIICFEAAISQNSKPSSFCAFAVYASQHNQDSLFFRSPRKGSALHSHGTIRRVIPWLLLDSAKKVARKPRNSSRAGQMKSKGKRKCPSQRESVHARALRAALSNEEQTIKGVRLAS